MKKIEYIPEIIDLIRDTTKTLRIYQKGDHFCNGVTFTQFNILDLIKRSSYMEISELNKELGIEKSTSSRLIEPLISNGYIIKNKSRTNKRYYELEITKKGINVHQEIMECIRDCFSHLPNEFEKEDFDAMIKSMRSFISLLSFSCCKID